MRNVTLVVLVGILLLGMLNSTALGPPRAAVISIRWTGADANNNAWHNPKNWDRGRVPQYEDDVIIGAAAGVPQPRFTAESTPPKPVVFITVGHDSNSGSLDIEGGNLECNCGMVAGKVPRRKEATNMQATVNMKGGTVKFLGVGTTGDPVCRGGYLQWPRAKTNAAFNMSGGLLDLGTMQIPAADYECRGVFNLDGGVINIREVSDNSTGLFMGEATDRETKYEGGVMNITGGKLILQGDAVALINKYVNDTKVLVPYPASDPRSCHKYVVVDFNVRNEGKTTVTAVKNDIEQAYKPEPLDGHPFVEKTAVLSWSAGAGAVKHDVYLCTCPETLKGAADPDTCPGKGRQAETTFKPGELELGKTYYWRVDEVDSAGKVTKGDIWSFTTAQRPEKVKPAEPNAPAEPKAATGQPVQTEKPAGTE